MRTVRISSAPRIHGSTAWKRLTEIVSSDTVAKPFTKGVLVWRRGSPGTGTGDSERGVFAQHRRARLAPVHYFIDRSEEHTSELQSRQYLVCRLLLEKKKKT